MDDILQGNTMIWLMVSGILIMLAFALAFVLFVSYSQKKILREKMQGQEQVNQHQEELLHSNILTQEEERKRIARDLHDAIGSKLNVILLNLYRLKSTDLDSEDVLQITDEVESVIHTTIDSTRRISHELLPPTLEEFGLVEAIRELQYHINNLGTTRINLSVDDTLVNIEDQMVELNLFRVLQELTSNSIRHGKAKEITMVIGAENSLLSFGYSDNGVGFDSASIDHKKGLGMKNIESRLQMIKATSIYQSTSGNGFQMNIELPINLD